MLAGMLRNTPLVAYLKQMQRLIMAEAPVLHERNSRGFVNSQAPGGSYGQAPAGSYRHPNPVVPLSLQGRAVATSDSSAGYHVSCAWPQASLYMSIGSVGPLSLHPPGRLYTASTLHLAVVDSFGCAQGCLKRVPGKEVSWLSKAHICLCLQTHHRHSPRGIRASMRPAIRAEAFELNLAGAAAAPTGGLKARATAATADRRRAAPTSPAGVHRHPLQHSPLRTATLQQRMRHHATAHLMALPCKGAALTRATGGRRCLLQRLQRFLAHTVAPRRLLRPRTMAPPMGRPPMAAGALRRPRPHPLQSPHRVTPPAADLPGARGQRGQGPHAAQQLQFSRTAQQARRWPAQQQQVQPSGKAQARRCQTK